MFEYVRILQQITNTPLLIADTKLDQILENLLPRLIGMSSTVEVNDNPTGHAGTVVKEMPKTSKIFMVNVLDSLMTRPVGMSSAGTSYQGISDKIDYARENGFNKIGFFNDSPGGQATGLFRLTNKIKNLPNEGIKTFSFVDGSSTSASYAISAATQKIYSTESSVLGSIAALMVHLDMSRANESAGKIYTIFQSKSRKALGNSLESLSEDGRVKLEMMVAKMDALFNNDIIESRANLTLQNLIDMEGDFFFADKAASLGLVDSIVPNLETVLQEETRITTSKPSKQKAGIKAMKASTYLVRSELSSAEIQTRLEADKVELYDNTAELSAAKTEAKAEGISEERTRITGIMAAAEKLNMSAAIALSHINKGYSAEQSLEMMTEIASIKTEKSAIDTSHQAGVQHDAGDQKPSLKAAAAKAGLVK